MKVKGRGGADRGPGKAGPGPRTAAPHREMHRQSMGNPASPSIIQNHGLEIRFMQGTLADSNIRAD